MRDQGGAVAAIQIQPETIVCLQHDQVGVNRRTLARWRTWWCEELIATPFWRAASGHLMPPVEPTELPASLLERFAGAARDRLISALRWISPITTGSAMVHVM